MYNIGIDVGGTSIKAGLVEDGNITVKSSRDVRKACGFKDVLEDIEYVINEILTEKKIKIEDIGTIGIGIPGVVDKTGCVSCVNLGLKGDPLELKLKENFPNAKIVVENDANVAAVAEYKYGSMKGYDIGVMLTLGTGVGGGIIINGKPFSGAHGIGSEIGHIILESNF